MHWCSQISVTVGSRLDSSSFNAYLILKKLKYHLNIWTDRSRSNDVRMRELLTAANTNSSNDVQLRRMCVSKELQNMQNRLDTTKWCNPLSSQISSSFILQLTIQTDQKVVYLCCFSKTLDLDSINTKITEVSAAIYTDRKVFLILTAPYKSDSKSSPNRILPKCRKFKDFGIYRIQIPQTHFHILTIASLGQEPQFIFQR